MSIENKLSNKKTIHRYILLFTFTYMVSYLTRINFGTVISEIIVAENIKKSLLSLAVTGSFITYGAGQLVSGYLGDRIQPKSLIFVALLLTATINALIPFSPNAYWMIGLWCVNGFVQAFMWPPLVRLMGSLFNTNEYAIACVTVSWGSSGGTILLYLLSPVIIFVSSWRMVFVFSAVCGLVMSFFWKKCCPKVQLIPSKKNQVDVAEKKAAAKSPLFSSVMLFVMLAITLQGSLRDGITTWMPSYIIETYSLGSELAILSGVILPLFSLLCFQITSFIYRKKITNPIDCAGIIFGVGFVAAVILTVFYNKSAFLSIFLSALLCGCMHGVNLLLVCMVPGHFEKFGNVSFASGLLNSFTYIGSAISTYGIALLCDAQGWGTTIALWAVIALVGTVVTLTQSKKYKKKVMDASING